MFYIYSVKEVTGNKKVSHFLVVVVGQSR